MSKWGLGSRDLLGLATAEKEKETQPERHTWLHPREFGRAAAASAFARSARPPASAVSMPPGLCSAPPPQRGVTPVRQHHPHSHRILGGTCHEFQNQKYMARALQHCYVQVLELPTGPAQSMTSFHLVTPLWCSPTTTQPPRDRPTAGGGVVKYDPIVLGRAGPVLGPAGLCYAVLSPKTAL